MTEPSKPLENGAASSSPAVTPKAETKGNPALRMLGLPRIRAKLPSRNWLIFLSITGSFTAALLYDRYHKKRIQQKWCNAVSHISQEQLTPGQLSRKITIFLAAPPGDGLRPAREHFQEYVKPILVAAALDWDVVEGRKEGDVRAELAERIRRKRRENEVHTLQEEEDAVQVVRQRLGISEGEDRAADLVLGRHTWKEYIRGLHEGWIGPLSSPDETTEAETPSDASSISTLTPDSTTLLESPAPNNIIDNSQNGQFQSEQPESTIMSEISAPDAIQNANDDQSPQFQPEQQKDEAEPEKEAPKPKPKPTPPYISPASYASTILSPSSSIPTALPTTTALPFPHLLGFLNTPVRMVRFLNRRKLADETGAAVAAFILSASPGPYTKLDDGRWEQAALLEAEEQDWHKSARKENEDGEERERPWMEDMVVDERIGGRMNKAEREGTVVGVSEREEDNSNPRDWSGGVDRGEKVSWGVWFKQAFDMYTPEPQCKGWEDGLKGDESE